MGIYAIADLHLSFGTDKPMDVFSGWENYTERLRQNWNEKILNDDLVVVPGDISWGMSYEQALPDFEFLDKLNGNKIILKGNHDYWFSTKSKTEKFLEINNISSIKILHNNHYEFCGLAVCGTRGWMNEKGLSPDRKVLLREAGRLKLSLESAVKSGLEPVAFLHYPPVFQQDECKEITDVLKEYRVKRCYYGHLHGNSCRQAFEGEKDGVNYQLISGDYIQFDPIKIV